MIQYLLPIHIIAGSVALIAAFLALLVAKGKKIHILAGRAYFLGMVVIFLTAIPMSIIKNNIFLFFIAIFSFYMAFSGIRFARNRRGIASFLDWFAVALMILSGISMWVLAVDLFLGNDSRYITLIVYGSIAIFLGYTDFKAYKNKSATGKGRIARHLTNMMAGTIAVITAVLVTNINIEPAWIWWILPTVIIAPAIVWWNRRVLGGNN